MGQPICLKDQNFYSLSSELTLLANQMAGLYICRNSFPASKNKLAGRASTDSSSILVVSYTLTPTPSLVFAFVPAPVFALSPLSRYTDKNLQKTTKLALELFVKG